jgi:hypothetical protein
VRACAETVFKSNQQNITSDADEKLATRRMPKRLNSQLDDPDFEPDSEELLDDFEIRKAPIKKRRNTRKSPQPSSRTEGRILRNHVKH